MPGGCSVGRAPAETGVPRNVGHRLRSNQDFRIGRIVDGFAERRGNGYTIR
jgi:hypothetical protein